MNKVFSTIVVAAGVVALSVSASPAVAATLPEGDRVYILPCDEREFNGLLYEVDTLTGEATRVGAWVNPDNTVFSCAGPGAYNPVNGLGYWISWEFPPAYLISVDLSTGINTLVGEFTLDDEPYYTPIALAIDDEGNAWGTSFNSTPDVLFSVNLTTAELTEVGPTGVTPESENYGLAWDPVTDAVYGYNASTNDFYTVNTATGAFTLFNDDVLQSINPYAMAFDSAGQVWGINGDIVSAPLADLDNAQDLVVINPHPVQEYDVYSESIIIVPGEAVEEPEPELAATGVSSSEGIATVGIMGLLLVMAGIVASRRRAARTT